MLSVTSRAVDKVYQIMVEDDLTKGFVWRAGVRGGGCSGLEYQFTIDSEEDSTDDLVQDFNYPLVVCPSLTINNVTAPFLMKYMSSLVDDKSLMVILLLLVQGQKSDESIGINDALEIWQPFLPVIKLCVDSVSHPYLDGATIDYGVVFQVKCLL